MDDSDLSDDDRDTDYDDVDELAAAAAERTLLTLIMLLQRKRTYPKRTRNKIDRLAAEFLYSTELDIHDMLCEKNPYTDDYRGLDSDRDTEDEVEAAIRLFPGVLSKKSGPQQRLPIHFITCGSDDKLSGICNLKAVSFIPLAVRLATEFGLFREEERGGLLIEDEYEDTTMQHLITAGPTIPVDQQHLELVDDKLVDDKCLLVIQKLRQMGLLKKEDIQSDFFEELWKNNSFAEKRFRFMIEWDPIFLTRVDCTGEVPLHEVALTRSMQKFQLVFEYGIRYYPNKKGISLLFQVEDQHVTPFQSACETSGRNEVMRVVEDTLIRSSSPSSSADNSTQLNVVEAILTAAMDENIHLDCVYFLFRRHPDVL
ncbi:hypothetical protein FRACYDRAFT_238355 [Fragilariopsis cylindrus CCMP1102]|uniref:Uncharacterized protein n=1 Tax=Fragilariopsis cylindrus CCMP1102 TaxID=635003 RepID=A0A1E7FIP7_9STRA|nr:hypothetical protein FRACYDRAFT_238355 [Fragilariopsis cylindrus CCMP1102]|eukprot:OEU17925.1 hypothetical protein FRACYDRAFT_238355 [Fragilariopsis cylindrus CCMP1102]